MPILENTSYNAFAISPAFKLLSGIISGYPPKPVLHHEGVSKLLNARSRVWSNRVDCEKVEKARLRLMT